MQESTGFWKHWYCDGLNTVRLFLCLIVYNCCSIYVYAMVSVHLEIMLDKIMILINIYDIKGYFNL